MSVPAGEVVYGAALREKDAVAGGGQGLEALRGRLAGGAEGVNKAAGGDIGGLRRR